MSQDQTLPVPQTPETQTLDRRAALGTLGKFGLGVAAFGLAGTSSLAAPAQNIDAEVLNFALNLEYLEAAFYLAAVGRVDELRAIGGGAEIRLPAGLDRMRGMQFKDSNVQALARDIAEDELAHVKFLHGALGKAAAPRPVLDLAGAFDAAGQAASGGKIKGFNPYANDLFFLHGAFIFEDVGVTAYNGAATLITNPAYLQAAAGILAVEAYHGGAIRTMLYQQRQVSAAAGLYVGQVVQAISNLRAKVGGGKDLGLSDAHGGMVVAPADQNGVAFPRSTREVLNIVYLAPGAHKGGFYPNGLNGSIK
ncbi:dessication-associated protein [Deinococcus geothermalis DSM 11300]|uniref:Dessication-associated protein n=1 Tax=Deinococcus geothermalis (strain DSM 11300 / CIP 105573 / AG-3a) TaxID=319795 RepID=Q1IYR5_DEIGD|nr:MULTISPECIES: ferritin-like domain-containing protein [Deinococcus]ABF45619.1 dessication-associated protein [Deinococcus geothermalis DSM 11300]TDE85935.1 ferritin-like domain-containing protein [Deinococcus sp. S9]